MPDEVRRKRQPARLPLRFAHGGAFLRLIYAAALASVLAFLSCSSSRAEIIVAAVGSAEPAGNPATAVRIGVELAVAGLPGPSGSGARQIRVVTADDQCSAAGGEAAARRVITEGASIVIGHVCSSSAIAAAPIYTEARVIFISPGARAPKFTDQRSGPGVFRLAGRSDRQAEEIAAAIMAHYPGKKAAILNDTGPQSRDLADAVHRALTTASYPVVHRDSFAPGEKDLAELVRRLKIAGSEIVFVPAQPHELAIILAQMRAQRLDAHVIGSDLLAVPAIIPAADLAGDALTVMLSWVPKLSGAASERVQPLMQLSREARAIALQSYAAVEAWMQALGASGTPDNARVTAALATKEFDTAIGRIRFSDRGDATIPSYALHAWRNGAWHRLD